ncbi:hypothetical protein N8J89_20570 [Crossiella sp. CA-258035]|uniref:hypothetical protein n=1 Tax=Crossiella sp. CA-258035 TaxID=2981138 RepID=UPI0024BC05AB|nr:hypothetical protein [Crossiella sp. CA-258035]WHT23379.1 hypothetical protein N8J89_20570 [Crossiella sp. CA-258035]
MAPSTNAVTSTWVSMVPVHDTALTMTASRRGSRTVADVVHEITAARNQEGG